MAALTRSWQSWYSCAWSWKICQGVGHHKVLQHLLLPQNEFFQFLAGKFIPTCKIVNKIAEDSIGLRNFLLSPVRPADATCKMHACMQANFLIKTWKTQIFNIHVFWIFSLKQQKFVQDVKVILENVKALAPLLIYWLNHYHFRGVHVCHFLDALTVKLLFAPKWSAWVDINLSCVISIALRGQIVSLSITCKINSAASKNMQNFIYFSSAKFWKQTKKKPRQLLWNSLEKFERHPSWRQNLGIENLIWTLVEKQETFL